MPEQRGSFAWLCDVDMGMEGAKVPGDPPVPGILPIFPCFACFSLPWRDLLKNGNKQTSLERRFPCKLRFLTGTPHFASALPVSDSTIDTPCKMGWPSLSPPPQNLPQPWLFASLGTPTSAKGAVFMGPLCSPHLCSYFHRRRGSRCSTKPVHTPADTPAGLY